MVSPIGSSTSTVKDTVAEAPPAAQKPMDKEAFLKLLVAQIKNQDPLKPMEGTEFVSQLSQFAMVEQAISQSTQLGNLSTQLGGIASNEAAAMVGKNVTVRGRTMAFDGLKATTANVTLEGSAEKVRAEIVDASGRVVRTIDIGSRPGGVMPVVWDGKDNAGATMNAGSYSLRINATAADGSAVKATQDVTGIVTKITFDKGYPELTLDNGTVCPISDLVAVSNESTQTQTQTQK